MRVVLLQINTTVGDIHGNAERVTEFIQRAAKGGPDLIVTPELALTGYPPRDLLLIRDFIREADHVLHKLAASLSRFPPVLIGTVTRNESGSGKPLYNSAVLCKNGKVKDVFHKMLLPAYDVFDEERYFEPGDRNHCLTIGQEKIGILICEDIWTEEKVIHEKRYHADPVRELAKEKINCLLNISASPFTIGKQQIREKLLSTVAKRYHTPVLYVNMVGGNDDLVFDGRSCAFHSDGVLKGRAKGFCEDILSFETGKPEDGTISNDDFRPEAESWHALVLGTRDYIRKTGFSQVLLGLSGGIDSSLTAAIAAEALNASNVLGVLLPSPYTSSESCRDAVLLAKNLNIRTITIPISPLMDAAEESLEKIFGKTERGITEENIQARLRGLILMAISNKTGALLLTTGNKSEMAVGYCTLYGDMSGGIGVIADVPKTMVYRIAEWYNKTQKKEIIPESVIKKPPSAELRPGQRDEDTLPPYDILDTILSRYIDEHASPEEIMREGISEDVVNFVCCLVKKAEFKRRQAAPGIRITDHAFGTGWRMPVASRYLFHGSGNK